MQMIYNSHQYYVLEFNAIADNPALVDGGYEIVDKKMKRELFLDGQLASHFRKGVSELIASEPSAEEVDEFLSNYDGLMRRSVVQH